MNKYVFTVIHDPRGFAISTGGKDYIAGSVEEAAAALRHWADREPMATLDPRCPICRALREEQEKSKLINLIREDQTRRATQAIKR